MLLESFTHQSISCDGRNAVRGCGRSRETIGANTLAAGPVCKKQAGENDRDSQIVAEASVPQVTTVAKAARRLEAVSRSDPLSPPRMAEMTFSSTSVGRRAAATMD